MEFTLIYEGPLRSNGNREHKHEIREYLKPQLGLLWTLDPLSSIYQDAIGIKLHASSEECEEWPGFSMPDCRIERGGTHFLPVVSTALGLNAEIDITWFRREEPGRVLQTGDIDNRLKTLFDGLQIPPHVNQFPESGICGTAESPFFCLLEDDALISKLTVNTNRQLRHVNSDEVLLIIQVKTRTNNITWANIQLL
jgi:hypothetical protein